jgi:DNA-binding NarL/FixJ family response regulator
MRERAALVDGTVLVESQPGHGVTVPAHPGDRRRGTKDIFMSKLRVVVADDHEMMREGLKVLVNSYADMEVVGEAANGRAAVSLAQELQPDVMVMDVSMPDLNGLKATEQITHMCPDIRVVALTRHTDHSYLQQLLEAGASGYVLKKSASGELVRAIRSVVAGKTYLDPEMTEYVVEAAVGRRAVSGPDPGKHLSGREREVLRYTAWGHANKEIAARLSISVKTVEVHKAHAMQKTGMKSRIDIVRYALLQGWLQDVD